MKLILANISRSVTYDEVTFIVKKTCLLTLKI